MEDPTCTTQQDLSVPAIAGGEPADLDEIRALLESVGLAADGVTDHLGGFLVVREGSRIVAAAGLEDHGSAGLLRSVAVTPDRRGRGLAAQLVRILIARSQALGHTALYLRTATAEQYFARFGFRRVEQADVIPAVLQSAQFQGGWCRSSVIMAVGFESNTPRKED
jgi:N-acetylglutamate synthase-like GNAT family acetyltransferase